MRQVFDAALTTPPEKVAEAIPRGIRRNAPRVLVGAASRQIDWRARCRPATYDRVVAFVVARLGVRL